MSGALLGLHGLAGIAGWRWLFIIEGLPAVLLGIVALLFLTDRPRDANWLTASERSTLEQRLEADAEETRVHGLTGVGEALANPRVLALGLLYFCIVVGLYGIGFWMPQVLKTLGLSNLAAILDCGPVVIGGGLSVASHFVLPSARAHLGSLVEGYGARPALTITPSIPEMRRSSSLSSGTMMRRGARSGNKSLAGVGSKVSAKAVPPAARARSIAALRIAWCPRWTPSKLPMATTG